MLSVPKKTTIKVVPTETKPSPNHSRTFQGALRVAAKDEHEIRAVSDQALNDAERRLRQTGNSPEK